ncbi:hypothetical protein [Dyadobacter sp. Leaf189]|uniref:hypothetical protein n=1 Tax=Dyadobacter sp. Leaf189 TaxID=1736295 RepID=UPI000700A4C8|nr:hypothetical protein [Dyadobacter sp. Leaf189]KQS28083.1 hypothetical protein ASG33_16990 [Dyadobacter sp. Leaf189]
MKSSKTTSVGFTLILCLICACDRDDGWDAGVPFESRLFVNWKLEKVVMPTRVLSGTQIGFTEIMNITNKDGYNIEEIFRNDTLFTTYFWRRDPPPIAKTKQQTVLITYRYGLKRFYKLYSTVGQPSTLEATDYLPELGGDADTVKFYYKQVW